MQKLHPEDLNCVRIHKMHILQTSSSSTGLPSVLEAIPIHAQGYNLSSDFRDTLLSPFCNNSQTAVLLMPTPAVTVRAFSKVTHLLFYVLLNYLTCVKLWFFFKLGSYLCVCMCVCMMEVFFSIVPCFLHKAFDFYCVISHTVEIFRDAYVLL